MYKYYCKNVKSLENAIETLQRDLRKYISQELHENEYLYTKLLSYLIVAWCEARLLKLLNEPEQQFSHKTKKYILKKPFSIDEIEQLYNCNSLKDRIVLALRISISKANNIKSLNNVEEQLTFTQRARFLELIEIIENFLVPSIEIRNRIAHGQWNYAFTNDLKNLSPDITKKLRMENIVSLQLNHKIFKALFQIIHDLSISTDTFERDFDKNYKIIEQNKINLHKRDYNEYKIKEITKYRKGILERNIEAKHTKEKVSDEINIELLVEGETDKTIIHNAWNKLFPNKIMPFKIRPSFGRAILQVTLRSEETLQNNYNTKFIGLFDFDEAYNDWFGLKEFESKIENEQDGLTKKHPKYNAYALLLPVPENRKNIANKKYGSQSCLSIELMFSDEILQKKNNLEIIEKVGGGIVPRFKGDKGRFAGQTQDFSKDDFINFVKLFEVINNICNDLI